MKIERTIIDHVNDRVECTGKIGYTHPITKQQMVEDYTVTLVESERLPMEGWSNGQLAVAVTDVLAERGVNRVAVVAPIKLAVAEKVAVEVVAAPVEVQAPAEALVEAPAEAPVEAPAEEPLAP